MTNSASEGTPLFRYLLASLEAYVNKHSAKAIGAERNIRLKFLTFDDKAPDDAVCYVADYTLWSRIFTGELNLEAISIGGCGLVLKPEQNIAELHHLISKLSYLVQSKIKRDGIEFFRQSDLSP